MKLRVLITALFMSFYMQSSIAMDVDTYKSLATETIQAVLSGSVDVDDLINKQKKLIEIGVNGCKEYAEKSPADAKIMNLVVANADAMQAMTLDEIEPAWHDFGVLAENGIDGDAIDHFGPVISHMDAVLHPATAIIALRDYKNTGNPDLLGQVKDELSEVLEHIEHVQ